MVLLLLLLLQDPIGWKEHRIDDEGLSGIKLRGADGLVVLDLDGDGHVDVVSVHEDSDHVRIAFGTKDPDKWESITLASGEGVEGCEDVAAGDLNNDKRPDLVVASESGRLTLFVCPKDPRGKWKATELPGTRGRGSWIRVKIADMNGDGKPDIVAANKAGRGRRGTFSIFMAPEWKETVVGRAASPVINAEPIDLDGDGDMDLVGASWGAQSIWFFENDKGRWVRHPIHSGRPVSIGFMLEFDDINGDGRIDVVSGSGPRHRGRDRIHWFEHPKKPGENWKSHALGGIAPDHAAGLKFVDLNGDGRKDLFVGGYSWEPWDREPPNPKSSDSCGRLAWFERPEDPTRPWKRHDISRRRRGMFDVFVVRDMNGDGKVDIVTTRGNSGEYDGVIWLEQVNSGPAFTPARNKDSPEIER